MLQQKWLIKLMGLNYEISYKKEAENTVADALSQLPADSKEGELSAITSLQPEWLTELMASYENDDEARRLWKG